MDRIMSRSLYELDFYAWCNEQTALLRAGKLDIADLGNIAEEIESLARREKVELADCLAELLSRLLRWRYQPVFRGTVWRLMLAEQRYRLDQHLVNSPSLRLQIGSFMHDAYCLARLMAERETGLAEDTFHETSPFTFDQAMAEGFVPD
jgi:hypothetical protein